MGEGDKPRMFSPLPRPFGKKVKIEKETSIQNTRSQDSSVGVATGYRLDDRGMWFYSWEGQEAFLSTAFSLALGLTQPSVQFARGGGLFPGSKVAGA
jgi:hypothetical protein